MLLSRTVRKNFKTYNLIQKRNYDTPISLIGCGINAYAICQTLDPYYSFNKFVGYFVVGTIVTFYGLTK